MCDFSHVIVLIVIQAHSNQTFSEFITYSLNCQVPLGADLKIMCVANE